MTEAELQAAVIEAAHLFKWLVHHVKPARTPDGKYLTRIQGDAGFPDLVMVRGDRTLFVELKSATGRLRPEQKTWLNRLTDAHQETFVWFPVDWTSGTIREVLR